MAYYNNGGARNNNFKYNNNNNRNNGYNPQYNNNFNNNNRNQVDFSVEKYKVKDITIADMNGNIYHINGNFSAKFITDSYDLVKKVQTKEVDINDPTTSIHILYDWTLNLLNTNTDGRTVTAEEVNNGFGDIRALYDLLRFISGKITEHSQEINNRGEKNNG